MNIRRNNQGQALLEAIIAMAVFAMVSAVLITMIIGGQASNVQAGDLTTAEALAEEGIEAVRSIQDRAWNEGVYDQSAVATSSNIWEFAGEGTDETIGKFTRTITFSDVCRDSYDDIVACPGDYIDIQTKKATVEVSWEVRAGITNTVEKIAYLTNWDSKVWVQTNWIGGDGQIIWSDTTKYDSDDTGVYTGEDGQVTLGQTLTAQGYNTWPFDVPADYTYNAAKIQVTGGEAKFVAVGGSSSGELINQGFEFTDDTNYSWPFTVPADYTYDTAKIEVTGGYGQLKGTLGPGGSGSTLNSTFDVDTSNWTFATWDWQAGDVTPTGTRLGAGGNPNGYVNIEIPFNAKQDIIGGYWQQSFAVTGASISSTCSFDWRITNFYSQNGNTDDLRVYVFVDSVAGAPTIGQEVWSSAKITGTTAWGTVSVDCSAKTPTAGTYYFKLAYWLDATNTNTGPMTVGFDDAIVNWTSSSVTYPSDKPTIYPVASYPALGLLNWSSFTETAVKNGGEVYYQLSADNGSTWQYWNGSLWTAVAGATDYNTAIIVNTNISDFSTSTEQLKFKAYLSGDGTQQVKLDNVNVGLVPHPNVWNFYTWGVGGGEVTPTGVKQSSGGNLGKYADITVPQGNSDEVGGYWQQSFTTISNNPVASLSFDYKVIDYNGTPDLAEIRIYIDNAVGDPVNQVGSSITVSGENSWTGSAVIDVSAAIASPGTYYIKLAYWEETGNNNGPVTVGFDNIDLSWQTSGYPSDKPTIRNTASFEPAAITSWLNFTEVATTTGAADIFYQLSDDDGATWQYWNGQNWTVDPDGDEGALENDYNNASTTNYYINEFNVANKKLMFKAFFVGDGSEQIILDEVRVDYNISEPSYYGNQFFAESYLGLGEMSKTTDKVSLRFTAMNNKIVNGVRVYLEQEKGVSPIYRYGLQADNVGEPSGIWLGATNNGYGDYQATAVGWQNITLNESVTISTGTPYHLVIEYQSGAINGGQAIELRGSSPVRFLNIYDSASNPDANTLFSIDNGASWETQGYNPIYLLNFSDITYEGNPYSDLTAHQVYGANYYGEQFAVGASTNISSVEFYISENNQGPEDNLYLVLYNVTDNAEMDVGTITDPTQVRNGVYTWVKFDFPAVNALVPGKIYRLYLRSPGSQVTGHYLVMSTYNDNNGVLNGINYDGVNSYLTYSTDDGGSWITTDTNYDITGFRFGKTIFRGSGYFISSAFDTAASSTFSAIEWDQATPVCSPACEVRLQVQTASDNAGSPGVWSATWSGPDGEDGDETDYFTVHQGDLINAMHNGDQWIRYKATLVGDSTDAPILKETRVYYK